MDLSQAEAVADLISSNSEASHQVAFQQMRGGFSNEIQNLRTQLLNFASLIELELDFAEEDVEFADRTEFTNLVNKISTTLKRLIKQFNEKVLESYFYFSDQTPENVAISILITVIFC